MNDQIIEIKGTINSEEMGRQVDNVVHLLSRTLEENNITIEIGIAALKELMCRVMSSFQEGNQIEIYIESIRDRIFEIILSGENPIP